MQHSNPLLNNTSSHKFITIGEVMLRLTPPTTIKSVLLQILRQVMAEAKRILLLPWRIWVLTVHFSPWFPITVLAKVQSVCFGAMTFTVPL